MPRWSVLIVRWSERLLLWCLDWLLGLFKEARIALGLVFLSAMVMGGDKVDRRSRYITFGAWRKVLGFLFLELKIGRRLYVSNSSNRKIL